MSLSFGLNIRKKEGGPSSSSKPAASKSALSSVFGAEESDDEDKGDPTRARPNQKRAPPSITTFDDEAISEPSKRPSAKPSSKPLSGPSKPQTNLSTLRTAQLHAKADAEVDPSIYDYDAAYTALDAARNARKATAEQDKADRRPRYIDGLLASAETRKKDQLRAQDKAVQREREAEGDEFADKEKFVTGAYREAQEEARRLEEQEKEREAQEAQKRRNQGMTAFYKGVMDEREKEHAEMVRIAAEMPKEAINAQNTEPAEKTEADIAAELIKQGRNIQINDEGQVTDKRELLSAGLNVIPQKPSAAAPSDSKKADDTRSKTQIQSQSYERRDARAAQRERQSRMIEHQLEAAAKRQAEEELEEEEGRKKAAKSQKTETEISGAKARFLARKQEREAAAAKKKASG